MNFRALNIFHVSGYPFHAGGIDTWLHNFICNNKDVQIRLFCPEPVHSYKSFDVENFTNLEIIYTGSWKNYPTMLTWGISSAIKIRNMLIPQASVLVLSTIPTLIPAFCLKKTRKVKGRIVCSVRGCLAQDAIDTGKSRLFTRSLIRIEKTLLGICDTIVANGWDTADYLRQFYGVESIVIPNGIAEPRRETEGRDEDLGTILRLKKSRKIILHIGTLRTIKGIDYIINACARLSEERTDFIMVFTGKGDIEKYKRKAEEAGIEAVFTGSKRNTDDYLLAADVVINVSGGSGVSNSLLEAMNNGKIVVAWNKKTFSQVITHGKNGLLAEYKDTGDLAAKISQGLDNVFNMRAEHIRESIEQFHWKNLNNEWLRVLSNAGKKQQ